MANVLAVKIRPRKNPNPKAGNLAHNSGLTKAKYWLDENPKIEQKFIPKNTRELNDIWNQWVEDANQRYLDNPDTKTKLRSQAVRIEEGMLIIGTDVAANRNTIKKIMNDFIEQFEKDNNTNVLHWAIHDEHEGHVDENGKEIHNRHIHFLFDNVNKNGKMVRSKWTRQYMKDLQTQIFEIGQKHIPEIERARDTSYDADNPTQKSTHGLSHRDYRAKKENDKKAKVKDLKEEVKQLRAELKESGAIREQYAELEQLNRELQEKVKNKDLMLNQLQTELDSVRFKLLESLQAQEELQATIDTQKSRIEELEQNLLDLEQKKLVVKNRSNGYFGLNPKISQKIKEYENKILRLHEELTDLKLGTKPEEQEQPTEYAVNLHAIHGRGADWQIVDKEWITTNPDLIAKIKAKAGADGTGVSKYTRYRK